MKRKGVLVGPIDLRLALYVDREPVGAVYFRRVEDGMIEEATVQGQQITGDLVALEEALDDAASAVRQLRKM